MHNYIVTVTAADTVPDGWRLWLTWLEVAARQGYPSSEREAEMLRTDGGRSLGIALFESEEDMRHGDAALNEMNPSSDQVGSRSSVEFYEVPVQTVG